MKSLVIIFSLLIISFITKAQSISGIVKDELGNPIQGSTISLLTASDSLIKLEVTNSNGSFSFAGISAGTYKITATHVSYSSYESEGFLIDSNYAFPDIMLKKGAKDLSAVVVTARKPLIQVRADKTIVNVEGSINATGNTALELLRKSPGVALDNNDNVSLNGKNGVRIYIDGRPSALSGQDLTAYLQSLQSASIEAIELIANPSSKFEAAGNAGIINIRLKKSNTVGTNGSVNAGFNVGRLAKYNSSVNLNHRNAKINLFGNYTYSGGDNEYSILFNRLVSDTIFNQNGHLLEEVSSHQLKIGIDYILNQKSILGASINGNFSKPAISNNNKVNISPSSTGRTDRLLFSDNLIDIRNNTIAFNLNYSYKTIAGKNFSMNADHAVYDLSSYQFQPNEYYDASGIIILSRIAYQMNAATDITITSFNADYEQNLWGGKLSLGSKWADIGTDNDFQRFNVHSGSMELDKERSNRFRYFENITAGYVMYNKEGKGVVLQTGLRVEKTNTKGQSSGLRQQGSAFVPYDSAFVRDYTDFFPSASLTFNKNVKRQLTMSYSRRIDRPSYQSLNPFEIKIDEYLFQVGNVNLRPQYTNSLGLIYILNQKLTTALNYSRIKDLFVQLLDTTEKSKSFVSSKNLGTQNIMSLTMTYAFQYKSYNLMANATAHYKTLKANLGTGRDINLDVTGFNVNVQNSLKFKNTWTAELTGFYNSPTIYGSNLKARSMWSIDAGLQKQLIEGKANIKFSISDLFNSLDFEGSSFFAGQRATFARKAESRQAKLSFTWRFGNTNVKSNRERKAGAEEEMKRVQ